MRSDQDAAVLREVLRQGERMLAVQMESRESALRRAGELLRLAIVTLAGVIVVGGILATKPVAVGDLARVSFVGGFLLVVAAAGQFALVLVGTGKSVHLAYGPGLGRVADEVAGGATTEHVLLLSMVSAMPDWLSVNQSAIMRIQQMKGRAMLMLATGSLVLLITLLYIVGGAIPG